MAKSAEMTLDEMANTLTVHDDYRVIRRYQKPAHYAPPPDDVSKLKTGIFLDVETTGFDAQSNHIIELAMVKFTFSSDGTLYDLGEEYDELHDPGVPIPEEITRITGIDDDMVKGHVIKPGEVHAFIQDAAIIVAHNASFDRQFVEANFEGFAEKAWACSVSQVDWRAAGFESAKLEYLAYRQGFFYAGHRAAIDCLAGIHILSYRTAPEQPPALAELLEQARKKSFRVWAVNSPFESKDLLKARGYRWNAGTDGRPKAWYKDCEETEIESEQQYLNDKIYGGKRQLPIDAITPFNRFSARI